MLQKKNLTPILLGLGLFFTTQTATAANDNPFTAPEIKVESWPQDAQTFPLSADDAVISFSVSPTKAQVLAILNNAKGENKIALINLNGSKNVSLFPSEKKLKFEEVVWDSVGENMFILAKDGNVRKILKNPAKKWKPEVIYETSKLISHLVMAPRPYLYYDMKSSTQYQINRLFFAQENQDKSSSTITITTSGKREYSTINPNTTTPQFVNPRDTSDDNAPSAVMASWSQPEAFHPAGHIMVWKDGKNCFHKALYASDHWQSETPILNDRAVCGGEVSYTPNGAWLMQWTPNQPGVQILFDHGKNQTTYAGSVQFLNAPQWSTDGKGLVGIVQNQKQKVLRYLPVPLPLGDVMNLWMYLESPTDQKLFSQNSGLFRPLIADQLYQVFDTETYQCGKSYNPTVPTRPYFVTTDVFWELYASAFEGLFVLSEKKWAIPEFWQFVESANHEFKESPNTILAKIFTTLVDIKNNRMENPEVKKIVAAQEHSLSAVTGLEMDYTEYLPQGHYTATDESKTYFRAFRYLINVTKDMDKNLLPLKTLSSETQKSALNWIKTYSAFISTSKFPLIWNPQQTVPPYVSHSKNKYTIFPLSWGIDNEAMFRSTFHSEFPLYEQVFGQSGPRILPSGLDVAMVLGSNLAKNILQKNGEFTKYPPLKSQLELVSARSKGWLQSNKSSLYDQWLYALSVQWSQSVLTKKPLLAPEIWDTKRLQTGLASWSTLRHSSLLVNARTDAECGESGFETIVLRAPRGYVEPDPKTFESIAYLFDNTQKVVTKIFDQHPAQTDESKKDLADLKNGILRRLNESREKVKIFQKIAEKETKGGELSPQEYYEILYAGRATEHNFLIFKSLAQKDFALSEPNPVPKVADVATNEKGEHLLVGVGKPLEWDQIISYYGRKEIVKGAVYSYKETTAPNAWTDTDWNAKIDTLPAPNWIQPFLSSDKLSCPAQNP